MWLSTAVVLVPSVFALLGSVLAWREARRAREDAREARRENARIDLARHIADQLDEATEFLLDVTPPARTTEAMTARLEASQHVFQKWGYLLPPTERDALAQRMSERDEALNDATASRDDPSVIKEWWDRAIDWYNDVVKAFQVERNRLGEVLRSYTS